MVRWCRAYTTLLIFLLHLHNTVTAVYATNILHFYTDTSCTTLYATIPTNTNAGNGQCGELTPSLINSASSVVIDNGCYGTAHTFPPVHVALDQDRTDHTPHHTVTSYTGPSGFSCFNDATLVPESTCTSMNIDSFSVDCPAINGTYDPGYTNVFSSLSTGPTLVSETPTTSSHQTTTTSPPTSSSATLPASSSTTPLPPPPFSLKHPSNNNINGGLSGPSTISLEVIIPSVVVIVAVVIGVLEARRFEGKY
ncbi:MAG: hypothetical protein Q9161_002335 [Pseudevernia consocians]